MLLVSVNAIDTSQIDCDQIVQCDEDGTEWSGANRVCSGSSEDTPETEQVTVTSIRIDIGCEVGDDSGDSIEMASNFYETASSNTYHGNGVDRFGLSTYTCDFGAGTVWATSFINDYNSDYTITREWSVLDENDDELDSCPTDSYNPIDITQTEDLDTFNMSFLPLNRNFDQYSEPGFDQSSILANLDYWDNSETLSRTRYDEIKASLQNEDNGTSSWDIFNIFSFADYTHVDNVLDVELPSDCIANELYCTSPTSTATICTAGTGINVRADSEAFFHAFFEKYKVPILMQLTHEWYYENDGNPSSFTGYYYWETAYGIDDSTVLTFQGMRQFTNRTITRVDDDWSVNAYRGVYVTCSGGSQADLDIKYDSANEGLYTLPQEDLGSGDQYVFIVNESYYLYPDNLEDTDFTTSDDLVQYDYTDDGSFDSGWLEVSDVQGVQFLTNSITSLQNMEVQVWGKGGKHSILPKYRVYNPQVNPDIQLLPGSSWSTFFGDGEIEFTPFGDSYSDIDKINYFCIDYDDDGDFEVLWTFGTVTANCAGITGGESFSAGSYNDLTTQEFTIDYGVYSVNGVGSYNMRVRYGMDFKSRTDYAVDSVAPYEITTPDINPVFDETSATAWNPSFLQNLTFDLSDSTPDNNIRCICIDRTNNGTYNECVDSTHATDNPCADSLPIGCGLSSCNVDSDPDSYEFRIEYSDVNSLDPQNAKARVFDEFLFDDTEFQGYQFRSPTNNAGIKFEYGIPDIFVGESISVNGSLMYSLNNTIFDVIGYVCYDLTNDGIYEHCYSNGAGNYCNLTCTDVSPTPVTEALVEVSYDIIGSFGGFQIKGLHNDGYTNSTDIRNYYIDPSPGFLNIVISSIESDDDRNDDFIIDLRDFVNIGSNNELNKTWEFGFTSIHTTMADGSYPDFACWDSLYPSGWEVCYGNNSVCNEYCSLNSSSSVWYDTFYVNSTNINGSNYVGIRTGNGRLNYFGDYAHEYVFNIPDEDGINSLRFFLVISIVLFLIIILFPILFLILTLGNIVLMPLIISRLFGKKRYNKDYNKEKHIN